MSSLATLDWRPGEVKSIWAKLLFFFFPVWLCAVQLGWRLRKSIKKRRAETLFWSLLCRNPFVLSNFSSTSILETEVWTYVFSVSLLRTRMIWDWQVLISSKSTGFWRGEAFCKLWYRNLKKKRFLVKSRQKLLPPFFSFFMQFILSPFNIRVWSLLCSASVCMWGQGGSWWQQRSEVGTNAFLLGLQLNVMKATVLEVLPRVPEAAGKKNEKGSCGALEEIFKSLFKLHEVDCINISSAWILIFLVGVPQWKMQGFWHEDIISRTPPPFQA